MRHIIIPIISNHTRYYYKYRSVNTINNKLLIYFFCHTFKIYILLLKSESVTNIYIYRIYYNILSKSESVTKKYIYIEIKYLIKTT